MYDVPFNKPVAVGSELTYLAEAIANGKLSGDGPFTDRCHKQLSAIVRGGRPLLTHSCTAALELAALLVDIAPGDEVIMPSYTFVSTANAVALRGGIPVFVDIRPDTLNLDETLVAQVITPRTRAIFVVHYAGICAEMDAFRELAADHRLLVVEDAAQALFSEYKGTRAGALGDLACFSFHETKNFVSGEGGALVVNNSNLFERAEIIREKGTNRRQFMQGLVDKYTWVDLGSSYLPNELTAAFLLAQLEAAAEITARRSAIWQRYHSAFTRLEQMELARRPVIPQHCTHNAHLYYLLLPDQDKRNRLLAALANKGILAPFHYVPLHSSPAGMRYGRTTGPLPVTDKASGCLLRLPLYLGVEEHVDRVVDEIHLALHVRQ